MKLDRWLGEAFLKKKNLYYKLNVIFGLFFSFPVLGFIIFSIKYDMLKDEYVPYFFLGVLVCSFIGFSILKNLFDKIASISEQNSAATEEVSASIEEVSAMAEEVTASAQALSDMAGDLQELVAQFRL